MPRTLYVILILLLFSCQNLFAGPDVVSSCKYQQKNAQLITYSGEVALPFQGFWRIKDSERPSQVQEVYLQPDLESIQKEDRDFLKSKFTLQREKEQKIQKGASLLRSFYSSLEGYAKLHGFVGPASFSNFDPIKDKRLIELNAKTWSKQYDENVSGDFAFLIPEVSFSFEKNSRQRLPRSKREKLMVELRPYVEDGKHWVLYNDGSIERENIDPQIIKQYALEIFP